MKYLIQRSVVGCKKEERDVVVSRRGTVHALTRWAKLNDVHIQGIKPKRVKASSGNPGFIYYTFFGRVDCQQIEGTINNVNNL